MRPRPPMGSDVALLLNPVSVGALARPGCALVLTLVLALAA